MNVKYVSRFIYSFLIMLLVVGVASGQTKPSNKKVKYVIATVNGESITIADLKRTMGSINDMKGSTDNNITQKYIELLDRLINRKLVTQEGKNIGLDSIPEIQMQMEVYRRQTLRDMLLKNQIQNIKANGKEIDRQYKEAIKEYKIKSVFIEREDDAKIVEEELKKNANFDYLLEKMIGEGKAKGSGEEKFMRATDFNQQITEILSKMNVGDISPVMKVGNGFTVVKIIEIKYPENPEIRTKVKNQRLKLKQLEALESYQKSLVKKYVKINKKLIDSLDFEASPAVFLDLLEDKRVLAEIKGAKPITVGDLSKEIKSKFYHGIEEAISKKMINKRKWIIYNEMVSKSVLLSESLRKKIDKTSEYKYKINEFYENQVFGMFFLKVVDPEITVKEEEVKKYYEAHKSEYTAPEMMKISSIAFRNKEDAERSIENLRKGMDFKWAKTNLSEKDDGKVGTPESKDLVGEVLIVSELPEHMKHAVTGTSSGEYRLCVDPDKRYLVLYIQEVFPAMPQPYEDISIDIYQKILKEKRDRSMEDWFEKLKKVSDIKIYFTKDELEKIVLQ